MKIRFRYNGLFILNIVCLIWIFILNGHIIHLSTQLKNYTKHEFVDDFVSYSNAEFNRIHNRLHALQSIANSAYDIAYDNTKDDWIIGLTTEQIDSIRVNHGK